MCVLNHGQRSHYGLVLITPPLAFFVALTQAKQTQVKHAPIIMFDRKVFTSPKMYLTTLAM